MKKNISGVLRVFNPATCAVLMVAICLPGFCVFSYLAGFAVSNEDGQYQNGNGTRLGFDCIQLVEGLRHLLLRRSDSASSYTASASQSALLSNFPVLFEPECRASRILFLSDKLTELAYANVAFPKVVFRWENANCRTTNFAVASDHRYYYWLLGFLSYNHS